MQMKYFHSKSFRSKTIRPRFFFTKIYQAMFLSCVLILSPVVLFSVQTIEACAQENDKDGTTSELYALSAVLMDADNGRILLQKKRDRGAAHGKYHQDYDLYPCFGAGQSR